MTKYILHGGKPSKISVSNQLFYREMFVSLSGPINLLCVYFARDKRSYDWFQMLEDDKSYISSACHDHQINFILASDQIETFSNQIRKSDVIFLKGGDTSTLLAFLKRMPNIEMLWKHKIIAGTSAGALVLSKHYYDGDLDIYDQGIGVIPIKLICHWSDARLNKIEGLKQIGENLQILAIPEEQYVIYY